MNGRINFMRWITIGMVGISLFLSVDSNAQMHRRRPNRAQKPAQKEDFHLYPVFCQFLDSEHVLAGGNEGLEVIEFATGKTVNTSLNETAISSMMSSPKANHGVLFGTYSGELYWAAWNENDLNVTKITGLENSSLKIVKSILFDLRDTSQIALLDEKTVVIATMDESKIKIKKEFKKTDEQHLFTFLVADNKDPGQFIVDGIDSNKYRVDWEGLSIKDVKDESLPHGYKISRSGVNFIPIGKNAEYLLTRYISALTVFMKQYPGNPQKYIAATVGKSPLIVTINKSNYYHLAYLRANHRVSFSADIDPGNTDNMIIATSTGLIASQNAGISWKALKAE